MANLKKLSLGTPRVKVASDSSNRIVVLHGDDNGLLTSDIVSADANLVDVKISDVRSICEGAFAHHKKIRRVQLDDSVARVMNGAFYACESLMSVEFEAGNLTSGYLKDLFLDEGCFANCTELNNVRIEGRRAGIGVGAFSGCTNLISVVLGEGVHSIDPFAFANCPNLNNLTIPHSVSCISVLAFNRSETDAILHIDYKGTVTDWENRVECTWGYNRDRFRNIEIRCSDKILSY